MKLRVDQLCKLIWPFLSHKTSWQESAFHFFSKKNLEISYNTQNILLHVVSTIICNCCNILLSRFLLFLRYISRSFKAPWHSLASSSDKLTLSILVATNCGLHKFHALGGSSAGRQAPSYDFIPLCILSRKY